MLNDFCNAWLEYNSTISTFEDDHKTICSINSLNNGRKILYLSCAASQALSTKVSKSLGVSWQAEGIDERIDHGV